MDAKNALQITIVFSAHQVCIWLMEFLVKVLVLLLDITNQPILLFVTAVIQGTIVRVARII
jgi:hypothetical protein